MGNDRVGDDRVRQTMPALSAYPPQEQATQFQHKDPDTEQTPRRQQRNGSGEDVHIRLRHDADEHEHGVHRSYVKRPPINGVPTETATATSAGLLLAGTAGTAMATRRSETTGAK